MEIQEYIKQQKELYNLFLAFIENEGETNNDFNNLITFIQKHKYTESKEELKGFLRLILKVSKNHHRQPNFFKKIEQIIMHFSREIKQKYSNHEIFGIFKSDMKILLFLFTTKMIESDEYIAHKLIKKRLLSLFFFPEIKNFIKPDEIKKIEEDLRENFPGYEENFEEKRQRGENDTYICQLIQKDSIDEFITYINRANLSMTSDIFDSMFETNKFLMKQRQTSLIEYAAFCGSTQIFNYLKFNIEYLSPDLWQYAIHGRNAEIISILEDNEVIPYDKSYEKYIMESIKCHHNDFADYLIENHPKFTKYIVKYGFHYCNYNYFPDDLISDKFIFYYACEFNYITLVRLLLNTKQIDVNLSIDEIL